MNSKEMPRNVAQVFKHNYPVPCDTFSCSQRAEYMIGRKDAPLNTCMNLCEKCLKNIMKSLDYLKQEKPETNEEKGEFVCDICGKSFDTKRKLNGHKGIHSR